jgi:D-alanyl-D-alanine carboxypeptidase
VRRHADEQREAVTVSAERPPAPVTDPDRLADGLARLLQHTVARSSRIRHGLLGVARTDGTFRWTGAAGFAREDGAAATPATPYPIASITKLYTATAVLLLHERGRLTLTDRMVDHLPGPLVDRLHVVDGVDRTDEITVRHLLAQTSGLPDFYEAAPRGGRSVGARLHSGEVFTLDLAQMLRLVRDELPGHSAPLPADATGRKARYGNTNYQLLGALIEQVTGRPLHQAFDELLFAPLGLTSTYVYPHRPTEGSASPPITDVWAKDQRLPLDGALRMLGPDGGLVSVLDDQLDFLGALVGGRIFADPATYQLMQERWNRIFFPLEYGLGTMRLAMPRVMTLPFRVPELVGHSGSTGTWLYHCPELGLLLAGTVDQAVPRSLPFRLLPRVLRCVQAHTKV